MSSELGPIRLYGQSFEGEPIPESVGDVSEEARLRSTPIGLYEFSFRQQPRYEFSSAVFFNGDEPAPARQDDQKQFEAIEEITEGERTLLIQSAEGAISIESLEIVPLDWRENPLDYTQLEDGESRRTIRYSENPPPESLRVRIFGLNVFDVESVTACVWANGRQDVRFPEPQIAFIERSGVIRVDRLDNPAGEVRGLEDHLQKLLGILFDITAGRAFEFDCRYQYQPVVGGPQASIPVMGSIQLNSNSYGENLSILATGINSWYRDSAPPAGAFAFGVKVYSVRASRPFPVLHLSQLLLPPEAITELLTSHK